MLLRRRLAISPMGALRSPSSSAGAATWNASRRRMIVYGVSKERDVLVVAGKASRDGNSIKITWAAPTVEFIARSELRAFAIVSDKPLQYFPDIPPDIAQRPVETSIWAAPKGKRPNRRPQVWEGWPIAGRKVLLLRPRVPVERLTDFELKQDGFIDRRRPDGALVAPGKPYDGPMDVLKRKDEDDGDSVVQAAQEPRPHKPSPLDETLRSYGLIPSDPDAPAAAAWGVQVAWIREQFAKGQSEYDVARRIGLPLASVRAAMTWVDPAKKRKRKARSL